MSVQLKLIKFVFIKYKFIILAFALTILIAAALELALISFIYLLSNFLLGNHTGTQTIIGLSFDVKSFSIWFFLVALLATSARIFIIIFQAKNIALISNALVTNIYSNLINLKLIKFRSLSEAEILSSLTTKVQHCADNILVQASQMLSAVAISVGIILALISIDGLATIIIFSSLAVVYYLIMRISKARLKKAAHDLSIAHDKKNKLILNILHSFESILIYGEQVSQKNIFKNADNLLRQSQKTIAIYGTAPRFLVEGLIIALGVLPLLYLNTLSGISNSSLSFIGAFIVGAIRLLPLINQIYAGLNSIRGSEYVAKDVLELLSMRAENANSSIINSNETEIIISTKGLSIELAGNELFYPDFNLVKGGNISIIGPSGAGKSKLLHSILGLVSINSGHLINNCFDTLKNLNSGVGYAAQHPIITSSSVRDIIAMGKPFDEEKVSYLLELTGLNVELGDRDNIGDRGSLMSGGQLQRLALCNALYRAEKLLILDEPTSAISEKKAIALMSDVLDYSKMRGISVICVTHDTQISKLFDEVLDLS